MLALVVIDKKNWELSWEPYYGQLALCTIRMMVQYVRIAFCQLFFESNPGPMSFLIIISIEREQ